jgi:hypothetical protein
MKMRFLLLSTLALLISTYSLHILRLFGPEEAQVPQAHVWTPLPGDLSIMQGIPALETKFKVAKEQGPQSGKYQYNYRRVRGAALQIELTFDFR